MTGVDTEVEAVADECCDTCSDFHELMSGPSDGIQAVPKLVASEELSEDLLIEQLDLVLISL